MRNLCWWILSVWLLGPGAFQAEAQVYRLRPIGSSDGLSNNFVHHLAQDAQGYLWIGTGEGAGRYDGRQVAMFTTDDGLAENFVSSVLTTASGTIWFGHNQGGISVMREGTIHTMGTDSLTGSTINALVEDGNGGIWAAAQNDGIVHVSGEGVVRTVVHDGDKLWYSLLELDGKFLLAGTDEGLHLFQTTPDGTLVPVPGFGPLTHTAVRALVKLDEHRLVLAGTAGEGILRIRINDKAKVEQASILGKGAGLGTLMVQDMAIGGDGTLVIGTFGQGAYEVQLGKDGSTLGLQHYHSENGLGTNNVSAVCIDKENGLWFARFGLGPARLLNRDLVHIVAEEGSAQDATSLTALGDAVWIGGGGIVLGTRSNDLRMMDTLGVAQGLPDDAITALIHGPDGLLWAGSSNNGLYRQDATGRFSKVPLAADILSQQVHALGRRGPEIWAGTSNGVFILAEGGVRHLTTENGLIHNRVNAILTDREGTVWMACNNGGVSMMHGEEIRSFPLAEGSNAFHVTGVAQDSLGTIWFSTYGNGVRYMSGTKVLGLDQGQGLRSDYCYAITVGQDNQVWVSHRGGASRIDGHTRAIHVFDKQFGIEPDRRINTLVADANGYIWFGTDKGVLRFNAARDVPGIAPPSAHLTSVKVSGNEMDLRSPIVLPPGQHRLQFEFQGISLATPEAVRYRYILEGHDVDWSEGTLGTAQYGRVQEGKYRFRVQAAIGDGAYGPDVATLPLDIRAPIWKRPWFIAAGVALLILLTLAVIWLRERSQRRAKQLLQLQLKRRTRELVRKNAEIELKNKDITDSINYAQRIQQAILPNGSSLNEHLPKNFVINRPRDIVSGDFHWFKRAGDKLTLVCADCTGHGVPGAFMSMIGSMLLREITTERGGYAPDHLLARLDSELRNVLHYEGQQGMNTDGMDISICELDLRTGHLSSSAAMHDVVLVRDGQVIRQRGSRRSIGGAQALNGTADISRHEILLQPGDRFYLFSDGVPDQFGGPSGKKLKVSGLLAWLEELGNLPLAQQGEAIHRRLDEWMNGQQQIDDMLLIGVEV